MNQASTANAIRHYGRQCVFSGLFFFTLASAQAADIFWTNTAGGNWSTAANWSPNAVPGPTDRALIVQNGTYSVTVTASTTVNALRLGTNNDVGTSGEQTLLILSPGILPSILSVNGSALVDTRGVLSLGPSSNAVVNFLGDATVAGTFNWAGGSIGISNSIIGSLTVTNSGTLNIFGPSPKTLNEPLRNYGRTVWSDGGDLYFRPSLVAPVTFLNTAGGVFDVANGQFMTFGSGTGPIQPPVGFINAGLFRKLSNSITGPSFIQVPFANSGTIQSFGGAAIFSSGLNLSGTLQYFIGGPASGSQYGAIVAGPSPPPPGLIPAYQSPAVSSIQLAGSLILTLTNGYIPREGDTLSLMSFTQKSGGFANVVGRDFSSVSNGLYFQLQIPSDRGGLLAVVKTTNAPPVVVSTNMADLVVNVGDTAIFGPPAGLEPRTYQWRTNGVDWPDRTNSSLVLTNCATNDSGSYCVVITDATNRVATYCATLVVLNRQTLTAQPVSQTVSSGSTITLSVAATSPTPLQYQWRLNGANIRDATNATYVVTTNAQPSDGGIYDALVAQFTPQGRSRHVVVSTSAVVTVTSPALPLADLFASTGTTNSRRFVGSGDNLTATNEANEPNHVGEPARHSVWLRWIMPTNGVAALSTRGSTFDTRLAVYTNATATLSNLVELASDDDSGGYFTSKVLFNARTNTTYYIALDGVAGASGRLVLSSDLDTNITAVPRIFVHPLDVTTTPGGTAVFSVFAASSSALSYQWYQGDWLAIPGATNATLVRSNVTFLDVDTYSVTVSAGGRSVESLRATLEIGPALSFDKLAVLLRQIGQTNFLYPGSFTFPSVSAGAIGSQQINNFNSTTDAGEPTHDVVGGSSRWFLLTAATNGTLVIDTLGSDIDTILEVYPLRADWYFNLLASDNNSAPDGIRSLVRFQADQTNSYLIRVDGVDGAQGSINLNWRMGTPPNVATVQQARSLTQGMSLTLAAGVSNNVTAPAYQWWCNGSLIGGATNASLTLSNLQFNQCGSYSVVVSNVVGAVTNPIATVTVDAPLTLTADPKGLRLSGSATQAVTLRLSTNLTGWTSLYTNTTPLLPVNFLDTNSAKRTEGFYQLKAWP